VKRRNADHHHEADARAAIVATERGGSGTDGRSVPGSLDDVPTWAVAAAVRRWYRGDCGARKPASGGVSSPRRSCLLTKHDTLEVTRGHGAPSIRPRDFFFIGAGNLAVGQEGPELAVSYANTAWLSQRRPAARRT